MGEEYNAALRNSVKYSAESVSGLVWAVTRCNRARMDAPALACVNGRGYCNGGFSGRTLLAHRVVWFLHHNEWPAVVDHIDGDRLNNRIENLRASNLADNATNRVGKGYTAVRTKHGVKYRAQITVDGDCVPLGLYSTKEARKAMFARLNALESLDTRTYKQAQELLRLRLRIASRKRCFKAGIQFSIDDYKKTGHSVVQ